MITTKFIPIFPDQRYDRDRSASPRPVKRDDSYRGARDRSASPNGRMNSRFDPLLECNITHNLTVDKAAHLQLIRVAKRTVKQQLATPAQTFL